jgi:hypothetical protein
MYGMTGLPLLAFVACLTEPGLHLLCQEKVEHVQDLL